MQPSSPLDTSCESPDDPCPERALACRAMAALGASEAALEAARRVDVVAHGLSPLEWAYVVLNEDRGRPSGAWAWSTLARV